MAPVDVRRVYAVFESFAVSPANSCAAGSGKTSAAQVLQESYIPTCFLAAATREAGYYPTASTLEAFIKTVRRTAEGAVTFAAFLQLCEDVEPTSRPGRSAVYELVDDIDTRGSGIISRRELLHILTSGAPTISEGEVSAILQLLDPSSSGYVRLNDLATVLIESSKRQRSPRSRSRSAREHHEQQEELAARAQANFDQCQAAPSSNSNGNGSASAARRPHSRQPSAEHVDPQLYLSPPQQPQPQQQQQQKQQSLQALRSRGCDAPRSPSPLPLSANDTQTPERRRHHHHHHRHHSHTNGNGERDHSFKRTDIGSNGEMGVRPYSSHASDGDVFERTQTSVTVDVDVQPSTRPLTGTAAGRSRSRGFAKPSPSPAAASVGAPAGSTPLRPFPPAPGSAGSSSAAASPVRLPLPTAPQPHGTALASESNTDEPRFRPRTTANAEGSDAAGRRSEQREFSTAESNHWQSGVSCGDGGAAVDGDGEGEAARRVAAASLPRLPAQKENSGKCCIVM